MYDDVQVATEESRVADASELINTDVEKRHTIQPVDFAITKYFDTGV